MTQPLKEIGPALAAVTLARAGARFLKTRPLAVLGMAARALAYPAGLIVAAAIAFYCLGFVFPFVGALTERALGFDPDKYYLAPVNPIPEAALSRWSASSFSNLETVKELREDSLLEGATFFALKDSERSLALREVANLIKEEQGRLVAQEEATLRREALSLLRSLRSGKSLDAALQALPPPAQPASTRETRELLAVQSLLESAKPLSSHAIPAYEQLIPRALTSAKARPEGWAWHQTGDWFRLGLLGLVTCIVGVVILAFTLSLLDDVRKNVRARQEALRQEWDRQSVERAAGSAKAPSKTPRL